MPPLDPDQSSDLFLTLKSGDEPDQKLDFDKITPEALAPASKIDLSKVTPESIGEKDKPISDQPSDKPVIANQPASNKSSLSSFIDSLDPRQAEIIKNHPLIQKLLTPSTYLEPPQFVTDAAKTAGDYLAQPGLNDSVPYATAKGFLGGALQGTASLLSPANIAQTVAPAGIAPKIALGIGALQGGQGLKDISEGNYLRGAGNIGMGLLGAVTGAHGAEPVTAPTEPHVVVPVDKVPDLTNQGYTVTAQHDNGTVSMELGENRATPPANLGYGQANTSPIQLPNLKPPSALPDLVQEESSDKPSNLGMGRVADFPRSKSDESFKAANHLYPEEWNRYQDLSAAFQNHNFKDLPLETQKEMRDEFNQLHQQFPHVQAQGNIGDLQKTIDKEVPVKLEGKILPFSSKDQKQPSDINLSINSKDEPVSEPSSNESSDKVLVKPPHIKTETGVEDGFKDPKFIEDEKDNSEPVPQPGKAKPDDDSDWNLQWNSAHKVLGRFDSTKDIANVLTSAQDSKARLLYKYFREFAEPTQGMNRAQREQFSQLVNHGVNDPVYNQANNITPDMIKRAKDAKSSLDDFHDLMVALGVKGNKGNTDLGYLEQYFPHMQRGPKGLQEQVKDIWSYYVGKNNPFYKIFEKNPEVPDTGTVSKKVNDMYDQGASMDPWSAFTMSRNNKMNPADMEWDWNRVMPAYLESMAKVAIDGPAVKTAQSLLEQHSAEMSPRLRDMVTNYINNYSGYDSRKALSSGWENLARSVSNRIGDSYIAFNPGIHLLHLMAVPTSVFPELGPQYTGIGIKNLGLNPAANFREMASLGLLQDAIKPMSFKTPGEKLDSIGYFGSYVESIQKGIAYQGALAKIKAENPGLSNLEAKSQAIKMAKDMTLTVDKSRQMQGLTPEGKSWVSGPVLSQLGGQFKGIPLKLLEQYQETAQAIADNPKAGDAYLKTLYAILGGGAAYGAGKVLQADPTGATKKAGLQRTFHIDSPMDMLLNSSAAVDSIKRIYTDIHSAGKNMASGNMSGGNKYLLQAAIDTAALMTKGGNTIRRVIKDNTAPGTTTPGSTAAKHAPRPMKLKFTPMNQ